MLRALLTASFSDRLLTSSRKQSEVGPTPGRCLDDPRDPGIFLGSVKVKVGKCLVVTPKSISLQEFDASKILQIFFGGLFFLQSTIVVYET